MTNWYTTHLLNILKIIKTDENLYFNSNLPFVFRASAYVTPVLLIYLFLFIYITEAFVMQLKNHNSRYVFVLVHLWTRKCRFINKKASDWPKAIIDVQPVSPRWVVDCNCYLVYISLEFRIDKSPSMYRTVPNYAYCVLFLCLFLMLYICDNLLQHTLEWVSEANEDQ